MKTQFLFLGCEPDFPEVNAIPLEFIDTIRRGVLLTLKESGVLTDRQYYFAEEALSAKFRNRPGDIND